ncbi:MAG TPA: type II toxin-antitoxin system HicB family antitoxin [Roseiflexaceae bacterium]|nr:type II toxin-antitoxin system HicB family antitoxin [Roseiflexaceae bacterium]
MLISPREFEQHGERCLFPIHAQTVGAAMLKQFKIIVEKHHDGYIAYPLGVKGVVIGQGDTYEEALADVKSAIQFHIETFGSEMLDTDSPVLEAFVAEAGVVA